MKDKTAEKRKVASSKEIMDFVKILDKEIPLNDLRVNLRKVAENRGLIEANLELKFPIDRTQGEYYNVYKYAFFGMIPDIMKEVTIPFEGKAKLLAENKM